MGKCPKVSMVSEGSEAILINKKFFMAHLSDDVQKRIRVSVRVTSHVSCIHITICISILMSGYLSVYDSTGPRRVIHNELSYLNKLHIFLHKLTYFQLQPYPSDESLQQRFQDQVNWDAFKTLCVKDHVVYNKYMNDTLNY